MSTDEAWVRWGRQDPYFAVITDPKYRRAALDEGGRDEFFRTGTHHVEWVLDACRKRIAPGFEPRRALDFGCGVGRVAIPLAEKVAAVVAVDISPEMLAEGARNAAARGRANLEWILSDDTLSRVGGPFDLVHSAITFQHIDVPRGRVLFRRLVELLAPGGVGAIQITYAKAAHASTFGQAPAPVPPRPAAASFLRPPAPPPPPSVPGGGDPEMQMNAYPLGELAFLLQRGGVPAFHAEFTDHGGELGVFLLFQKAAAAR